MSELRKDPVVDRWVIIATERAKRPTDYVSVEQSKESVNCPFCEGNENMTPPEIYAIRDNNSFPDTKGWQIRVVHNKFPALSAEETLKREDAGMFVKMSGTGAHEIIIETPYHNDFLHQRSSEMLVKLLDTYRKRMDELMKDTRLLYAMIFRNMGERAGASLSHPHTQIIATPVVPKRVSEEINGSLVYYGQKKRCIFCDIISEEKNFESRLVYENNSFISFCPYASRFPFEIWLMPKRHISSFLMITDMEIIELADCLGVTIKRLVISLGAPHYNFMLHTVPNKSVPGNPWPDIDEYYHCHFEIFPKLTRVAGFEWGTGFYINPTPPEDAAAFLREADI